MSGYFSMNDKLLYKEIPRLNMQDVYVEGNVKIKRLLSISKLNLLEISLVRL